MTPADSEKLIAGWLEDNLSSEDEKRLQALLAADPDAVEELANQKCLDATLRVLLEPAEAQKRITDSVISVLQAKSPDVFKRDCIREIRVRTGVQGVRGGSLQLMPRMGLIRRKAFQILAFAACLYLCFLGWSFWAAKPNAFIASISKGGFVERGGNRFQLKPEAELFYGDTLRTSANQILRLKYKGESTEVEISGNSTLQIIKSRYGKRFLLSHGGLWAKVASQPPKKPMTIVGPQGVATVLGTELAMAAKPHSTWLQVNEGSVQLTRVWDQTGVKVGSGQYAVAARGIEMVTHSVNDPNEFPRELPVRIQYFSDYSATDQWEISREAIRQKEIARAFRLFKFSELQGAFRIDAVATINRLGSESPVQDHWGFGLGLARKNAARTGLASIAILQCWQGPDGVSHLGFSADAPPNPVKGAGGPVMEESVYRIKLTSTPIREGVVELRGKIWPAGDREPADWMITSGPLSINQPFDEIMLTTSWAAVTFSNLQMNFIE